MTRFFCALLLGLFCVFGLTASPVLADEPTFNASRSADYLSDPGRAFSRLGTVFSVIFTLVIFAGAATAVIFLIIGGVQYTTASDPAGAAKARSTITYAIVGLLLLSMVYIFMSFFNKILLQQAPCNDSPDSPCVTTFQSTGGDRDGS